MSEKRIEERIIDVLKNNEELNILDISSRLDMDRHTISKYLEILKTKNLVSFSLKGKSKLWKLTNNSFTKLIGNNDFISKQVLELLSSLNYEISIQSKNYDIIWHNQIKEEGKCYELLKGKKTKCKNCLCEKVFETGEPQKTTIKNKNEEKIMITQPLKNELGEVIAVIELTKGV